MNVISDCCGAGVVGCDVGHICIKCKQACMPIEQEPFEGIEERSPTEDALSMLSEAISFGRCGCIPNETTLSLWRSAYKAAKEYIRRETP